MRDIYRSRAWKGKKNEEAKRRKRLVSHVEYKNLRWEGKYETLGHKGCSRRLENAEEHLSWVKTERRPVETPEQTRNEEYTKAGNDDKAAKGLKCQRETTSKFRREGEEFGLLALYP